MLINLLLFSQFSYSLFFLFSVFFFQLKNSILFFSYFTYMYKLAQLIVSIDVNRIQLLIQKLIAEFGKRKLIQHETLFNIVYNIFIFDENPVCHETISKCCLRLNWHDSNIMHWLRTLIRICSKQLNGKRILYSFFIFTYYCVDDNKKRFTIRNIGCLERY